MLDFGRLFPPFVLNIRNTNSINREAPKMDRNGSAIFYNLLRPSFVRNYRLPLCSDGFSRFIDPSESTEMNKNLEEATDILFNTTIPALAQTLEKKTKLDISALELISKIHYHGVNIRHLGRIRSHVKDEHLRKLILTECVARTVKNCWRKLLRKKMEELKISLLEPYLDETYLFLKPILRNYLPSPSQFVLFTENKSAK